MTGVGSVPERWQTCTARATGAWGFAAAHGYVMHNFDASSKDEADKLVEGLRSAFQELVTEADWMDSETQVCLMSLAQLFLLF